ncbi:hypothetical protein [Polaromonas sp.]|uniref:hypothetical protein n=1 Tax=Polaromonas sp. TaxID=1869339 RepID=UPI00326564BB
MQRVVKRIQLHVAQEPADLAWWLTQPIQSRIDALEALRLRRYAGCSVGAFHVQRVCRITQLKRD